MAMHSQTQSPSIVKSSMTLWRWIFFIVGNMTMALGISMTIKGQWLGIGPWDVLHVGLYRNFGLSIGSWGIITGFIIILSTAAVLKQWPQIGTWINMVAIGSFIDLFNWLLPEIHTTWGQTSIYTAGVLVLGFGVALYVAPNIGAGPRDSLMLIFVKKFNVSVKWVRTMMEITVGVIGWLLGGPVGVGTVLIALLLGQIIQLFMPPCKKMLLKLAGTDDDHVLL